MAHRQQATSSGMWRFVVTYLSDVTLAAHLGVEQAHPRRSEERGEDAAADERTSPFPYAEDFDEWAADETAAPTEGQHAAQGATLGEDQEEVKNRQYRDEDITARRFADAHSGLVSASEGPRPRMPSPSTAKVPPRRGLVAVRTSQQPASVNAPITRGPPEPSLVCLRNDRRRSDRPPCSRRSRLVEQRGHDLVPACVQTPGRRPARDPRQQPGWPPPYRREAPC